MLAVACILHVQLATYVLASEQTRLIGSEVNIYFVSHARSHYVRTYILIPSGTCVSCLLIIDMQLQMSPTRSCRQLLVRKSSVQVRA